MEAIGLLLVLAVIIFVPVIVVILYIWRTYNGLVELRNRVKNGWSQIDVQLKRRYDLIPNLVNTAKGYMTHERETLEAVIKARQTAIDAKSVEEQIGAENQLTNTLSRLMMLTENYPDLKANSNMQTLMEELTSTENRIGFARQHYNDSVQTYNTRIQQFPGNLIANNFSFTREPFFELEDQQQRQAPQVQF